MAAALAGTVDRQGIQEFRKDRNFVLVTNELPYLSEESRPHSLIGKFAIRVVPVPFIHKVDRQVVTLFNNYHVCPQCDVIHEDHSFMISPVYISQNTSGQLVVTHRFIYLKDQSEILPENYFDSNWLEVDPRYFSLTNSKKFNDQCEKVNSSYVDYKMQMRERESIETKEEAAVVTKSETSNSEVQRSMSPLDLSEEESEE